MNLRLVIPFGINLLLVKIRNQCWHGDVSNHLSPTLPGLDSGLNAIHGLSLLVVYVSGRSRSQVEYMFTYGLNMHSDELKKLFWSLN